MKQKEARRVAYIAAAVVFVAAVAVGEWLCRDTFACLLVERGSDIYSALLSASVSMLGFMMTVLTISASLIGQEEVKELREKGLYQQVTDSFFHPIGPLSITTLASLLGLFFPSVRPLAYITLAFICLTVPPMVYAVRVLRVFLAAISKRKGPPMSGPSSTGESESEYHPDRDF